ncbi:MAG TPA: peptidoglycan DD-metalloendopeptidase family protein [Candidatus Alistipes intestinipullorum]|nr:peptidoglycan DD-metalloendopeptidase family protein [Candidatus Alistipes intestinipullorum]
MKTWKLIICALLLAAAGACNRAERQETETDDNAGPVNLVYGIDADLYRLETSEIASGETLGKILSRYGVSAQAIDRLDKQSADVFPLRNIRAGQKYTAFIHEDSLYTPHLDFLAYEISMTDYVVFGFQNDSITIRKDAKSYTLQRKKKSAVINSSLWGAIMEQNLPYALAAEMEEIYQWTVDFFGIQKGDSFTVIYDERFIDDSVSVGIGRIWGAKFTQGGKEYYAIPFRQGGKIQYWEADGASLRKQMLKAPLKYTRISSRFSYARKHPIYKVYRPHTGIDYAAPKGTHVHAVADGVVTFKGWGGGGGNTLKIKHAGGMMTGYLHLSGYAKGIAQGTRVSQGQLIGYVGSTGASTGPHLDYRVWKNGKPIDPLKIPSEPAEPISKENRAAFEFVRDRIMAELNGDVAPEERITQLDSIVVTTPAAKPVENSGATAEKAEKK